MLGVQLPPDAGTEGVHCQALSQAAQELHRRQERQILLGPGDGRRGVWKGNPCPLSEATQAALEERAQTPEISERL